MAVGTTSQQSVRVPGTPRGSHDSVHVDRMRTSSPGLPTEPPIRKRPVGALTTLAVTTASLLIPTVAQAADQPAPPDHHDVDETATTTRLVLHATRSLDRELRPPGALGATAVAVAVAPPPPVVPVQPVQVATYRPRHAAATHAAHHTKSGNSGNVHYAAPPASGSSNAIVAYAETFLGVPYVYGAASRSGTDCSGLLVQVYAHFGIHLQHLASSFYGVGRAVSRADLQPGDILVLDGGGHAGIYVGNGLMIHAPHTGTVVQISPIWSFSAARRVL